MIRVWAEPDVLAISVVHLRLSAITWVRRGRQQKRHDHGLRKAEYLGNLSHPLVLGLAAAALEQGRGDRGTATNRRVW